MWKTKMTIADPHHTPNPFFDFSVESDRRDKFVQKYTFLADRPQEGTLMVERKMEGGMWKTKMTIADPYHTPNPFFDFSVESDRKTKLHGVFKYDNDNHWEIKVDRVPGQSITGVVTINGMEYKLIGTLDMAAKKLNVKLMGFQGRTHELDFKINTGAEYGFFVTGDGHGPVDIKMVVKKHMKKIDFVVKYNNVNYAYIKLNGDAVMQGVIPTKVDYIMKYNIMDSEMEGKAKVNYNGQAPANRDGGSTLSLCAAEPPSPSSTMRSTWSTMPTSSTTSSAGRLASASPTEPATPRSCTTRRTRTS